MQRHRHRFCSHTSKAVVPAVAVLLLLALAPSASAVDRSGSVTPDAPFSWEGPSAVAHNEGYDGPSGEPCGKTVADYCDETLVNVDAGDFFATSGGGVEFAIGGYDVADSDFDLYVYASDASGAVGELVGSSADVAGVEENVAIQEASGYYLVRVIYWDVEPASGYDGTAEFFRRAKFPPDIDDPPGLQDFLASDPFLGFRSHSEPHIAQSPANPNVLVAASKMYNRDRDSLAEYEFKIGTYVSFNRGRTWHDLGQLDVCRPSQAPPESWPLTTRAIRMTNPNRGGTGPEDADDDRGQGDFGEEYITSDPWVDFDERGNAYVMVLDSPAFASGNGWGRVLPPLAHPVASGPAPRPNMERARSRSTPMRPPDEQALFLDDKNTFAVNNAARWRQDGHHCRLLGPELCRSAGQGSPPAQQTVCERSTDGGRSWPDEPTPVSPPGRRNS